MTSGTGALKIGLIGTGGIARMHQSVFRDFPDEVELTAVCDVREDAAREFAAASGEHVAVYHDVADMLARADLDAVDICTPHDLHAPQAIAAVKAGKHVLVEKPMACSVDECREMVAAAEAADVTLMVGQPLRYLPANAGARQAIANGELGQPWYARSDDWFPGIPTGWMADKKRSGGGVLHMGATHHIDLLRFFFGDVGAVRAHWWTGHPGFQNGAEDRIAATLEFESGVVAQLSACWAGYVAPHFFEYTVLGDAGALYSLLPDKRTHRETMLAQHHAPPMMWSRKIHGATDGMYSPVAPATAGLAGHDPFVNEILHFASSVRYGTEPTSSGRDNLGTMKAVYGCYESARSGREVQLMSL